uniref:Uncharacterized protein n=1 Tax=Arundo donax TaxID=35708 RepID=A0A0A8Y6X6_ARUDO
MIESDVKRVHWLVWADLIMIYWTYIKITI